MNSLFFGMNRPFYNESKRWRQYLIAAVLSVFLDLLVVYLLEIRLYYSIDDMEAVRHILRHVVEAVVFILCVFPPSMFIANKLLQILREGKHDIVRLWTYLFMLTFLDFLITLLFRQLYSFLTDIDIPDIPSLVGHNVAIGFLSTIFYMLFFNRIAFEEQKNMENAQMEAMIRRNEAIRARLDRLTVELDPHYVFNGLSTLSGLIELDSESAEQFLEKFSLTFRYLLDNRDRHIVPVREEFKFLKNYVALMEFRYDNVEVHLDSEIGSIKGDVPVAALQELVENAVKHNTHTPSKRLTITLKKEGDHILVRNNKNPLLSSLDSTHMGLNNLTERYRYLSDKAPVIVEDETVFSVQLPILYPEDFTELE